MHCNPDTEIVHGRLLEDILAPENRQKGKQVDGMPSGMELAVTPVMDDVLTAGISSPDRTLAISNAMVTDGNILASICHGENVTEQDRLYAATLDDDDDARDAPAPTPNEPNFDNGVADDSVLGYVMDRLDLTQESGAGEGPSHRPSSQQAPAMLTECVSCMEQVETSGMLLSACGHSFCLDCTRQMVLGIIKQEQFYPPRCCGYIIPPSTALRVLNYEELCGFSDRVMEYMAKDPIYCAVPTCSKFIPPFAMDDDYGTCPACRQKTHLSCLSLEHPGVDCPTDETLQRVLAMANAADWQRCFHCRTMVELQQGCNHIRCRCGWEFCCACGQVWKTCSCCL
ncbi:hypothetical protein P168DRAFT_260222, partial [Aspergillus campestris IBT 28561]